MFSFWSSTPQLSVSELIRKAKEEQNYISEQEGNHNASSSVAPAPSTKIEDGTDTPHHLDKVTKLSNVDVIVYALNGCPEAAIVLAALDSRGIPHRCKIMSFSAGEYHKNMTPMNGGVVVEIEHKDARTNQKRWAKVSNKVQDILEWIDESYCKELPQHLSLANSIMSKKIIKRANEEVLAAALWHLSWIDEDGFSRSMRRIMAKETIPFFVPPAWGSPIADYHSMAYRTYYKAASREVLMLPEEEDYFVDDGPLILSQLVEELYYFQSLILRQEKKKREQAVRVEEQQPHQQQQESQGTKTVSYMLGGDLPTGADFAVYGQLECLVGTLGDFQRHPAHRSLKEAKLDELGLLWKWHDMMRKLHPIEYKHKTM